MMSRIKVIVAAALVVSGLIMFRTKQDGMDLVMILAGLVYLYIRWHGYKRARYQARMK
jgi:hypothetical protein